MKNSASKRAVPEPTANVTVTSERRPGNHARAREKRLHEQRTAIHQLREGETAVYGALVAEAAGG